MDSGKAQVSKKLAKSMWNEYCDLADILTEEKIFHMWYYRHFNKTMITREWVFTNGEFKEV